MKDLATFYLDGIRIGLAIYIRAAFRPLQLLNARLNGPTA